MDFMILLPYIILGRGLTTYDDTGHNFSKQASKQASNQSINQSIIILPDFFVNHQIIQKSRGVLRPFFYNGRDAPFLRFNT